MIQVLTDKATLAGITVHLVDERGTSSTCPACQRRVPKPRGRTLSCPHCRFSGHRDLVAAASIATRTPGGGPTTPTTAEPVLPGVLTHRRVGRNLPGTGRSRRDPRRPTRAARGSDGPRRPAPPPSGESLAPKARIHNTPPEHPVNVSGHRTSCHCSHCKLRPTAMCCPASSHACEPVLTSDRRAQRTQRDRTQEVYLVAHG
ncbi:zinc ribbon domain-containing protein [Micromonospora luteifusca]|uniref:zinc ribbon domain-containing protein n=1 Tax=Micromonospora luteifusca TaxID=709860 RepID=UPI0019598E5F